MAASGHIIIVGLLVNYRKCEYSEYTFPGKVQWTILRTRMYIPTFILSTLKNILFFTRTDDSNNSNRMCVDNVHSDCYSEKSLSSSIGRRKHIFKIIFSRLNIGISSKYMKLYFYNI